MNLLNIVNGVRQSTTKTPYHSHPFWQVEIATRFPIRYTMGTVHGILHNGDILIIPPHAEHEFLYDQVGTSWYSFKFEYDGDPHSCILRQSPFTEQFIRALEAMVKGTILKPYEKTFIEGLIQTLFVYIRSEDFLQAENPASRFASIVMEIVRQKGGKPVNINELAEHLSYTRSHLSKQFKQHTGESLKTFIDRTRLEKAKELLRYDEFNISDIAEELGFRDIFSFSRFFKRNAGMSPREFKSNFRS